MVDGDHPEEDASEILDDAGHQRYQMLIGMLNWIACIGRMDVAFATTSLSRFTACPRQGHMDRVLRIFGIKYRKRMFFGMENRKHSAHMFNLNIYKPILRNAWSVYTYLPFLENHTINSRTWFSTVMEAGVHQDSMSVLKRKEFVRGKTANKRLLRTK